MNCHLGWVTLQRGINWNVFNTPVHYGLVCWRFMGQKLRKKAIESLTLSDTLFTGAVEKQILFIFILEKNRVFKVSSRVTGDVVAQEKHCIYGKTERALSHHWKTLFQASWASWGPARVTWKTSPAAWQTEPGACCRAQSRAGQCPAALGRVRSAAPTMPRITEGSASHHSLCSAVKTAAL